jgi:hypothetical protein
MTPPAAGQTPSNEVQVDPTASWTPYIPDTKLSAAENLLKKEEYDAKVPKGHDPNKPLVPQSQQQPQTPDPFKQPDPNKPADQTQNLLTLDAIKVPDGFVLDDGLGTELVSLINQKAANPAELAQGLIDLQIKAAAKESETASQRWDAVQADWKKQTESDPQIGGANYTKNVETSKQIAERFGGPKFAEALELTGMGNHPDWVRFTTALAPFVQEGSAVPRPTPTPPTPAYTPTNLYPDKV